MQELFELKKKHLNDFLRELQKKFQVIVPVLKDDGASCFQEFNGQELFLEKNTTYSPKKFFQPPKDEIFRFKWKANSFDIEQNLESIKRVIFGIRPCDINALVVLDEILIKYFKEDPFYHSRRKNTLLIGLQCNEAEENCFCESMGMDKAKEFDLMFFDFGKKFLIEVGSKKGKALVSKKFFKKTSSKKPVTKLKFSKKLNTKNLPELFEKNQSHRVWKQEAERCLNCTACTQVCPTCYCFSINDVFEVNSENSSRFKCWDSCHLQRFTRVAGNHVFRDSREERLKQFVQHKLYYFYNNHEVHLCVGCGRCISACPVKIDLTYIANELRSGKNG